MDEEAAAPAPERRIPLPWLITPIVALSIAGMISDIIGPGLINERPLLQMFLNPRNRYLLLASPNVDAVPFFVVGFIRLVLTDPLFYILGLQYGEAALKWAEEKLGEGGSVVRTAERWFAKAAPAVILIAPSGYMCLLAGAAGMRIRLFVTLNVLGTIGRLTLIRLAGEAFRPELESALDWIQRYQWWLIGASFVVVSIQAAGRRRTGELESPHEIEEEILEVEHELHDEDQPPPEGPATSADAVADNGGLGGDDDDDDIANRQRPRPRRGTWARRLPRR